MFLKQTTFLRYIYSFAAVLYVQSVLHVMLFPMLNMFCTFTSALPAVCSAQYGCFLQLLNFTLSLYVAQVLSDWFWDIPVTTIITGITSVFTVHMRSISTVQSLYFSIFSAPLLTTFLSPQITSSVPFSSSHITLSSLLLATVLSICTVHSTIWLPYRHDLFLPVSVHGHTSVTV